MLPKIIQYFNPYLRDGICIAFSGGVDSSLLLKAACMAREEALTDISCKVSSEISSDFSGTFPRILAVIAETRLHPQEDTLQAKALANSMGADCLVLSINEFEDERIMSNPVNRCYLCKRLIFSSIKNMALENGRAHVFDGTNQNDTAEYRPGLAALGELGIRSPLKELGITKDRVREMSRKLRLVTSDKPSTPCMATRLPYGARLDYGLLHRIHQGENLLRAMGFYNVRLRYHEPLLRIEVDLPALDQLIRQREAIVKQMKELGFSYITLDLEGFRSGSMDISLT